MKNFLSTLRSLSWSFWIQAVLGFFNLVMTVVYLLRQDMKWAAYSFFVTCWCYYFARMFAVRELKFMKGLETKAQSNVP